MYSVALDSRKRLILRTPYQAADLCRRIPDSRMWDAALKAWKVTPSRINVEYLRKVFPEMLWSPEALVIADAVVFRGTPPVKADVSDYVFRDPPPYEHQREGFARARDAQAFALLMEQRTGKTRVAVDVVSDRFLRSQINLAVVLCPNSVKSTWAEDEIPNWTPTHVPYEAILYRASERKDVTARLRAWRPGRLQWLVMNVEALSTSTGADWLKEIITGRQVAGILDEATRFKNHTASRTKHLLKMRGLFSLRLIMTGTLVTKSPLDVYAPFSFLDPAILGYSSFYSFRNDFALLGGYGNTQIVGYVNTERLAEIIKPFSLRVLRENVFDMPKKLPPQKLEVELAPEQRRLYDQMRDLMIAELEEGNADKTVTTSLILTQMLRLQQIVGGFLPLPKIDPDDRDPGVVPIPGRNPKLIALLEELEEIPGKVIVWARFRPEIALIANALRNKYGDNTVVEFHGGIKEEDRTIARRRFQAPEDACRFFVGQIETGGVGIDLSAANDVIYYSNSFSLESRLQSEDRVQHPKRPVSCGYLDLIAKDTLDLKLIAALREKKSLADVVNGDNFKEWI